MTTTRGWFWVGFLAATGCGGDGNVEQNPDGAAPIPCPADDSTNVASATQLESGTAADGYLCPIGDLDFYAFEIQSPDDLVFVELSNDVPLTAIDLGYTLLDSSGEMALATTSDPDGSDGLTAIAHHHRVPAGETHYLSVRDQSDDEQDTRNAYTLTTSGAVDPDTNEPNDDVAQATALDGAGSGYIASFADHDVYQLTALESATGANLLRIELSATDYATGLRADWRDSTNVVLTSLEAATSDALAVGLETLRAVPAAGAYTIEVSAFDGASEDFATPYSISAIVEADPDPNESPVRNDDPTNATPLLGFDWDGSSTDTITVDTARIASAGDRDVYQFTVTPGRSIVEVSLDGPAPLQWTLQIIAPDHDFACSTPEECAMLEPCMNSSSCLSSSCVDGFCQSSGDCLPSDGGRCGVTQFVRSVVGGTTLETAQPLLTAGTYYLIVGDQGGDQWSSDAYTMEVTLRPEPDNNEPNDDYNPYPLKGMPVGPNLPYATDVAFNATETGYIAYEADNDWYRVEIPCCAAACPCGATADACRLEVDFDGPAELRWEIYAGSTGGVSLWANFNEATAGSVYGDDECFFYLGQFDTDEDAIYVRVRDEGADDWHAASYSFSLSRTVGCLGTCESDCSLACGAGPACDFDPAGTPPDCSGVDAGAPADAAAPATDGPATDGP